MKFLSGSASLKSIVDIFGAFSDEIFLEQMALEVERFRSTKLYAGTTFDDLIILAEDEVANTIGCFAIQLVAQRLSSVCVRMFGLLDQFLLLVHPEARYRDWALQELRCIDEAFHLVKESRARFWVAMMKKSPLATPIVKEFFAELRRVDFTVSEDIELLCGRVARSFSSSALTERGFQEGMVAEHECHDRRMNYLDLWSKVVHDKQLSDANGFSEIGTESLPSAPPGESKLPANLNRLSFRSQRMPFRQVVSTSRSAPYQTCTPATSAYMHEGLKMMSCLHRTGRLDVASAWWRASLLQPGLVVRWADLPGLCLTFGARLTCVCFGPLEEYDIGEETFWGLQTDMVCTRLAWRSLLDFEECKVLGYKFVTPMRVYLSNDLKLPMKLPPVFMHKC